VVTANVNTFTHVGMMNIGVKPTLGENKLSIEVHLLDFDEDIYNQNIQIHILERLRDEKKFESFEALQTQLKLDKEQTILYFDHRK